MIRQARRSPNRTLSKPSKRFENGKINGGINVIGLIVDQVTGKAAAAQRPSHTAARTTCPFVRLYVRAPVHRSVETLGMQLCVLHVSVLLLLLLSCHMPDPTCTRCRLEAHFRQT